MCRYHAHVKDMMNHFSPCVSHRLSFGRFFLGVGVGWGWGCTACGFLVPHSGIKPESLALEVWSLNHWTAREVLKSSYLGIKNRP